MQGILSGDFPIADVLHQTELSLPISFGHTHGDMRRICEAVARFDTRQ
jgi:dTDP-4-amino-4,6-dideoxygalactose transaminase